MEIGWKGAITERELEGSAEWKTTLLPRRLRVLITEGEIHKERWP
jgi:hypothetical protein